MMLLMSQNMLLRIIIRQSIQKRIIMWTMIMSIHLVFVVSTVQVTPVITVIFIRILIITIRILL